jgi:hypothetical protein
MIIIDDTNLRVELARIVNYDRNCSFVVLATVITNVNYNLKTYIVQVTGVIFCHKGGQCYITFYSVNLLPFHSIAVILCYNTILPLFLPKNASKISWYKVYNIFLWWQT